jgi:hypothetical protein
LEWSDDLSFDKWKILNKVESIDGTYMVLHDDFTNDANNYYRLKLLDNNGNYEIFPEIVISNNDKDYVYASYNLLGQEVDQYYSGIVIQKYNSGKIVKIIR